MRANLDLYDQIYAELCAVDFFGTIAPLAANAHESEALLMSKFRTNTVEDYIKSLRHILSHSCHIKLLTGYMQNV